MPDNLPTSGSAGENKKEVIRITAKSFFDEMVDYGFDDGDVINFTTAILDLLISPGRSRRQGQVPIPSFRPEYDFDEKGRVHAIRGPNLFLKRLSRGHVRTLQVWREAASYQGTLIEQVFEPDTEKLLDHFTSDLREFFLVNAYDDSPLGFLTYERDWNDPSRAMMQKFLADTKTRGRGFGTEMTYLWLHYGFGQLGLRKISAKTVDSNLANINLNRKLGFHFEGHLRQEVKIGGVHVDVTIMSVLRDRFTEIFGAVEEH